MHLSKRLKPLSFNVFADMDRAKGRAKAAGQDLIDLSLGSSDLPAPRHALEAISQSLQDSNTHGYSLFSSTQAFREAVARWYSNKFDISLNPETEVLALIGSQEGTAHLPLAILDPGDFALLQDPGYPSHCERSGKSPWPGTGNQLHSDRHLDSNVQTWARCSGVPCD